MRSYLQGRSDPFSWAPPSPPRQSVQRRRERRELSLNTSNPFFTVWVLRKRMGGRGGEVGIEKLFSAEDEKQPSVVLAWDKRKPPRSLYSYRVQRKKRPRTVASSTHSCCFSFPLLPSFSPAASRLSVTKKNMKPIRLCKPSHISSEKAGFFLQRLVCVCVSPHKHTHIKASITLSQRSLPFNSFPFVSLRLYNSS